MFALQVADWCPIDLSLTQIANNKIEFIEIIARQCLLALAGHYHLMTELAESVFEESTQLIVIIHDENPAFFHQTPISRLVEERYRCATALLMSTCTKF